jgi:hypothetical protein
MIKLDGLKKAEERAILLVGAGAVLDSWNPVLSAMRSQIPELSRDTANIYFATLVHRLRWLHAMSAKPGLDAFIRGMYSDELHTSSTSIT